MPQASAASGRPIVAEERIASKMQQPRRRPAYQGGNKCPNTYFLGFSKENMVFERFMGGEVFCNLLFYRMKSSGGASKVMRQFPCSRGGGTLEGVASHPWNSPGADPATGATTLRAYHDSTPTMKPRAVQSAPFLGCDIHTHTHAQEGL